MNAKDIIIIVLVIAIILVVGGIFALSSTSSNDGGDDSNITNETQEDTPQEVTKNASMESKNTQSDDVTAGLTVVKEEVVFNGQAGEGYIREVTYSDGNFRQYDNATGEFIGSSFEGDQARLGNPNGELE